LAVADWRGRGYGQWEQNIIQISKSRQAGKTANNIRKYFHVY
jgi:hypothetical protein